MNVDEIVKERGAVYGHPMEDFGRAAEFIAVLDKHFTGHPALKQALRMVMVKVARLCQTNDHRDSVADGQGYFKCYGMVLDAIEADATFPPIPPISPDDEMAAARDAFYKIKREYQPGLDALRRDAGFNGA